MTFPNRRFCKKQSMLDSLAAGGGVWVLEWFVLTHFGFVIGNALTTLNIGVRKVPLELNGTFLFLKRALKL